MTRVRGLRATPGPGARARLAGLCLAASALFVACPRPAPVVQESVIAIPRERLRTVAIVPFHAAPRLADSIASGRETSLSAGAAAELVASFVAEAMAERGIAVVSPNDVVLAFEGQGVPTPRLDPRAAGEIAASKFGATAVLLGTVSRYRERVGESLGASGAASVAFEVSLHAAPGGQRLWTARFDETQQALSENVLNARRYPGGGTRWLTAAELARWGAGTMAERLATSPVSAR